MDYGKLLSRSWQIVWNNKFMFVLGFLAALGGSGGGGSGGGSSYNTGGTSSDVALEQMQQFFEQYAPLLIGLLCFGLLLGLVLWLVRLVAEASMISAAARIDAGEKMTFSTAFAAGTAKLGRMVGLGLVMFGPFAVFALVGLATFFGALLSAGVFETAGDVAPETVFGSMGAIGLLFACLGCLAVPFGILVSIIYPFAQRGAVLQDLGVVESIRHGWRVVSSNVVDIILLIILFLVITFLFGIVTAVLLIPFALITVVPMILSLVATETVNVASMVFAGVGVICLGVVGAAISSIARAFQSTTVTLAYQQFVDKKPAEKAVA